MGRLSQSQLERVTSALLELHSHQDFQTLPQHLITITRKLVPVDISTYNEIDGRTKELRAVHDHPGEPEKHFPAFFEFQHQYGPLQHAMRTGQVEPTMVTDFVSQRQFERTALFNEFYKLFGIRHHMASYLPHMANCQVGTAFFRLKVRFTEEERTIYKLISAHLCLAWQNCRALAQVRQLDPASSPSQAVAKAESIILGAGWRVRECSEVAMGWLQGHFHVTVAPGRKLPELFVNWLKRISSPSPEELLRGGLGRALVSRGTEDSLEISWMPESPLKSRLNLVYQTRAGSLKSAKELGLTTREAQVLSWLLEGKTNPETSAILGISPNTVRKHLERIYAKLGVENRMAAMRSLRDFSGG